MSTWAVRSARRGTERDITARIRKARQVFAMLCTVWKFTAISTRSKLQIFSSNVKFVLIYGSETRRVTSIISKKTQIFINKCLRQILHLKWFDRLPNADLWARANHQVPMHVQIRRRKWRWVGHTLRKKSTNLTSQAFGWNPQGKRKCGRPKQTWRKNVLDELMTVELTWQTANRDAKDRKKWRTTVESL